MRPIPPAIGQSRRIACSAPSTQKSISVGFVPRLVTCGVAQDKRFVRVLNRRPTEQRRDCMARASSNNTRQSETWQVHQTPRRSNRYNLFRRPNAKDHCDLRRIGLNSKLDIETGQTPQAHTLEQQN